MRHSRRNFIKFGIGSVSIPVISGVSGASSPQEISIRRDQSDPLSSSEIDEIRESFADDVLSESQRGQEFALAAQNSFNNREVVAYNLKMVDGTPREFIGTYAPDNQPIRIMDANSPGRSDDEMVSAVHQAADNDEETAESGSGTPSTSSTPPDNWDGWETKGYNKSYNIDSKGNTYGWTVKFKNNPEDGGVYGVESEARMDPAANNPNSNYYYRNRKTTLTHDWQTQATVDSDMFDHEPENQDTTDDPWTVQGTIGVSPSVTVGKSDTVDSDGVVIQDSSSPDRGEYADALYGFTNTNTRERYSEVNSVSVAHVDQEFGSYPTVVDIDMKGVFGSPELFGVNKQKFENGFRYNIFGN